MLTRRIIGKILLNGNLVIQSKQFCRHLPIGKPHIVARFLDEWGVDEIFLVDRLASKQSRSIATKLIEHLVETCRAPLTVAGGIRSVEVATAIVKSGADRIALNSALLDDATLLPKLADVLGRQAIVAAIDFVEQKGAAYVYDHRSASVNTQLLLPWCLQLESLGAGELLVHSVADDGLGKGYRQSVYSELKSILAIPLIASGGYGMPSHIKDVFSTGVDAVAIGNSINYTEHSISTIKSSLNRADIRRAGVSYNTGLIESNGRLRKQNDDELEEKRFVKRAQRWL